MPGCFSGLGMNSQKGDVCLRKDSTGNVPELTEAVGTSAEDRPRKVNGIIIPLVLDPELLKYRFQVLDRPSCNGWREGIYHLLYGYNSVHSNSFRALSTVALLTYDAQNNLPKLDLLMNGWVIMQVSHGFLIKIIIVGLLQLHEEM
jgi:hypothetical protein